MMMRDAQYVIFTEVHPEHAMIVQCVVCGVMGIYNSAVAAARAPRTNSAYCILDSATASSLSPSSKSTSYVPFALTLLIVPG